MAQQIKLMNRHFVLLWMGLSVSRLGAQAFDIAMLFWVKHATDSATLMGMVLMLASLPAIILSPIGGAWADRYSRRRIILLSEAISGISILSLAALMFLAPGSVEVILIWLVVVSILGDTIGSFYGPAMSAAIPDLVPEKNVAGANSLSQLSVQAAVLIGQGIGGTLFRLLGAPLLFLINSLTYLFSAACVSMIHIPQSLPQHATDATGQLRTFWHDLVKGFRYVWSTHGLRELVLVSALLSFFTVPVIMLLPFYVEDHLKATVDWYGFLMAAYSIGSIIGYILVGSIRISGKNRSRLMVVFIILESIGYGLLGLTTSPLAAVALAFLGGCVSGFVTIIITTLLQITTPGDMRGRVFGLLNTISGSLSPIALGLTGVVTDLVDQNIPLIYVTCGTIMALLSIVVSLRPRFRAFLAFERTEPLIPSVEKQAVLPG
ncbi:MAG: MFS transporter [Chloroflexi bacterium]|nr:MFS transporter [Chloroflexota bacterium]